RGAVPRRFRLVLAMACVSTAQADARPAPRQPIDTPRREVELADPAMAATPQKREELRYLARCALSKDVVLYTRRGTERFTFPGQMGLAPGWLKRPMTGPEERWVSAWMLARGK